MTTHVSEVIAYFKSKVVELTDLIEKLEWFQREFPHTAAAVVPISEPQRRKYTRRAVVKKPKAARKNDRQTDRQSKARAIEPSAQEPP